MRFEVWVTATGDGDVPESAVPVALALLGDDALGCEVGPGSWRMGLVVEADGSQAATGAAQVQAQAVALLAGLPDWPLVGWSTVGEGEERDLGDGFTEVSFDVSAGMTATAVPSPPDEEDE